MPSKAVTVQEYLNEIPAEQQTGFYKLRDTILQNIPQGFEEVMSYGMIGYVVPHSLYAPGYHCTPQLPLPFISIASQKNFIALYHMGLYANKELLDWFTAEYPKHSHTKLDMGKSCIRFKNPQQIPYELIAQLVKKVDVETWINWYEAQLKK